MLISSKLIASGVHAFVNYGCRQYECQVFVDLIRNKRISRMHLKNHQRQVGTQYIVNKASKARTSGHGNLFSSAIGVRHHVGRYTPTSLDFLIQFFMFTVHNASACTASTTVQLTRGAKRARVSVPSSPGIVFPIIFRVWLRRVVINDRS